MSGSAAPASIDADALLAALARWCDAMEAAGPELNELDARLGDGDLGATLARCAANVRASLAGTPAVAPGAMLKACAQACAKASDSSFGTLLAVAFLAAAKAAGERERLEREAMVSMLDAARETMSARGGAALGDKTVLDSLAAVADALRHATPDASAGQLRDVAVDAAARAVDTLRARPNRIGRARMFGERSVGLEDPGMVAALRMAQAL